MSVTLFSDNALDVATITSQRLEGSVQAAQTISKVSTMLYRFTYRRVKASNLQIDQDQIPLLSQPTRVGMPGFSYLRVFFQAEDGIRDLTVTGVQTCALPI